jgi:hypothetical protein
MNWGQALIALDTGERCRYRGIPVIVAGVEVKRMARIDNETKQSYCVGDRFYSCRLLGAGNSGGTMYEGRLDDLMTEHEYLESLKKQKEEHHETKSTV